MRKDKVGSVECEENPTHMDVWLLFVAKLTSGRFLLICSIAVCLILLTICYCATQDKALGMALFGIFNMGAAFYFSRSDRKK